MRLTLVLLLALLGFAAAPAAAQPAGRVDAAPIVAALADGERIVEAPGAVAHFDEARVRAELGEAVRLVVLPYVNYDLYPREGDHSQYYDIVNAPIQRWSLDHEVQTIVVTGLDLKVFGVSASTLDHRLPADFDELRTTTATRDVTERVVVLARIGRGIPPHAAEDVPFTHPAPVPAPGDRVAEVVAALRKDRVHNAPGRTDPVEDWLVTTTEEQQGLRIRVAAFPYLEPGQPVPDYATPLAAAFPDDVVLVLHGDWLDIVAADQSKALAARAYAYSDAGGVLSAGGGAHSLLRDTLKRLDLLLTETAWGHPQPPPQPWTGPFDVQRTVATLAPWVLIGSAVVLGGAGVVRHRRRAAAAAVVEERELRAESAAAMAAIGDLGARVLSAEEAGTPADPAAAERHATARLLYDQAHTSRAMAEVRQVAEEGLALLTEVVPEPEPERRRGKKKRNKPRPEPASSRVVWRKAR